MLSEDDEVPRLQQVEDMLHGLVYSQYLWIGVGVFLLGQVKVLAQERKGLSGVVDTLLQHGTQCGRAAVCDECKWRGSVGVHQESGA
jgi:hypothetical protein